MKFFSLSENVLKENEEEILKEVKSPQMFLPSRSDNDSVKMNGLGKKILGDGVQIIEFPGKQNILSKEHLPRRYTYLT